MKPKPKVAGKSSSSKGKKTAAAASPRAEPLRQIRLVQDSGPAITSAKPKSGGASAKQPKAGAVGDAKKGRR